MTDAKKGKKRVKQIIKKQIFKVKYIKEVTFRCFKTLTHLLTIDSCFDLFEIL